MRKLPVIVLNGAAAATVVVVAIVVVAAIVAFAQGDGTPATGVAAGLAVCCGVAAGLILGVARRRLGLRG